MLGIIKKDLKEMKDACIAKNMKINLRNIKHILTKYLYMLMDRVNKIEKSLIAKGYDN